LLDVVIEAPNRQLYVPVEALHRHQKHLFRYFLDGSARTFYIGNVLEGLDRQTPVHVAQIGAAAVVRDGAGRMRVARSEHRLVLLMDQDALSFGEKVKKTVEAAGSRFEFVNLKEADPLSDGTEAGKQPRSRAAHKANWRMRMLESLIGRNLVRSPSDWLMLDGGLGSEYVKDWPEGKEYLGVVKSSYKELHFSVKAGRVRQDLNVYQLLAGLKAGERTLVFGLREGAVATWYVRIRGPEHLDFPLMGVLRVELPNPSREAVPSELINEISGALVAERCETPHGKDVRWHAHLYAIFLAEQAVKNGFASVEVIKAGLRWPSPPVAVLSERRTARPSASRVIERGMEHE
jgi:hypothetical protein